MDPLTHGLLGGAVHQSLRNRPQRARFFWVAFLSAMAPDLDVLIRSSRDSLLLLEYHRHFSHSLIFIPFGAAIVATVLWLILRRRPTWTSLYGPALVGYATHGLLDTCTSYGTSLVWPFSGRRLAWDWIAIIDPVFTVALLAGIIFSFRRKNTGPARWGLALAMLYLSFGVFQNHQALRAQQSLLSHRGHQGEVARAMPTIGNLFLWRTVYREEGNFYVDAVRVVPGSEGKYWEGGKVPSYSLDKASQDFPGKTLTDLKRYEVFTQGYWGEFSANLVGDVRYSALPQGLEPLWGIRIDQDGVRRVEFDIAIADRFRTFLQMLRKGQDSRSISTKTSYPGQ